MKVTLRVKWRSSTPRFVFLPKATKQKTPQSNPQPSRLQSDAKI